MFFYPNHYTTKCILKGKAARALDACEMISASDVGWYM